MTNQAWVPEVGEECEYYYSEGEQWRKGEVVAFYKGEAILIDLKDGLAVNGNIVRKLNTDEDRAVEEMVSIFSAPGLSIRDGLRKLYRAGYRSQEAQPNMSDPANWQAGDYIKCLKEDATGLEFTPDSIYEVYEVNNQTVKVKRDNRGKINGWGHANFCFHSRP